MLNGRFIRESKTLFQFGVTRFLLLDKKHRVFLLQKSTYNCESLFLLVGQRAALPGECRLRSGRSLRMPQSRLPGAGDGAGTAAGAAGAALILFCVGRR